VPEKKSEGGSGKPEVSEKDKPAGGGKMPESAGGSRSAGMTADPGEAGTPGKSDAAPGSGRTTAAPFFARISRSVEKRWVQFFVLVPLLSFIALGLNIGTQQSCFGVIVVPLVVLVIPYYFGIKKIKTLFVIGILSLLLSGMMWGVVDSHCLSERKCGWEFGYVESSGDWYGIPANERSIIVGTVDPPAAGPEGRVFTFTLVVNESRVMSLNRTIYAVYFIAEEYSRSVWGGEPELNKTLVLENRSDPTAVRFVNETSIAGPGIYLTQFFLVTQHQTNKSQFYLEKTFPPYLDAPVTAKPSDVYASVIAHHAFVSLMVFGIGLLFMLSILWWSRRARQKREEMEKQLRELEEEEKKKPSGGKEADFACTACGAGVSAEDAKCPSCGAVFEEEPAAEGGKEIDAAPAGGKKGPEGEKAPER
jgi:hypothetical protein